MKISELQTYMAENMILPSDSVESLISRLIHDGHISSFMPLIGAYIQHLEKKEEYRKCELIEAASLLHCEMSHLPMDPDHKRALHIINKFSNMNCDAENQKYGPYDPAEGERQFKENFDL